MTAANKQAETSRQDTQTRYTQLEKELADVRQARTELDGKYARALQAAQESGKHITELQKQLSQGATESKQQVEELRKQLATTTAANKQAEAGWQETQTRYAQLEKELAGVQQARAELDGKYVREQQAAQESGKRITELEKQLSQSATEAKQQAEDLRKQLSQSAAESIHTKVESEKRFEELRKQLETSAAACMQAEAGRQELHARSGQLEKELAGLRQTRAELDDKYAREQQAAQESNKRIAELEKQLGQSATESKQQVEELRKQLATTAATNKQAEAGWQETQTRYAQLEKELAGLRQARAELDGKYAREQQASQASSKRIAELEKQLSQSTAEARRAKAESEKRFGELRKEFETSTAACTQAETGRQELRTRCGQLEKELAGFRQASEDLSANYAREHQVTLESSKHIAELEKQLSQSATESKQQVEALRKQLTATATASERAEAGRQETQMRCGHLEKELEGLRQARAELDVKCAKEHQVSLESGKRIAELEKQKHLSETAFRTGLTELENRVRQGVASLAKVTADLERERFDHRRLEQHASSLAERLQGLHEELSRNLAADKAVHQRIANLDEKLRQREEALTRVSAELQQETADRQLAEEQLQEAQGREDQFRKNVSVFEQARRIYKCTHEDLESRLSAGLGALRESESSLHKESSERQHLAEALAATNSSLGEQTQKAETLQSQLEGTVRQLAEIQSRLQKETSERQRLAEAFDATQRALRDQSQSRELEVSKLESALQLEEVERKRLETQVLRSHRVAFESARTGRVVRNALRRQIRQPIDELCQSTRRLLQSNLDEEQNRLVQTVLENALLVQTNLRDASPSNGGSDVTASEPPKAEPGQMPALASET
jgi:chromosome segregation ATPase